MLLTDLYSLYLRRAGAELVPGDFFDAPDLDDRRHTPAPHSFAELRLAAQAAGYGETVPDDFLDELDVAWLEGAPEAWPFRDDARAAAYCDLAVAAGLLVEA
jgi:hypothetical protein